MIPRVACFARNPGLGNRNSYRVARISPIPTFPKGKELSVNHFNLLQGIEFNRGGIPTFTKWNKFNTGHIPALP